MTLNVINSEGRLMKSKRTAKNSNAANNVGHRDCAMDM